MHVKRQRNSEQGRVFPLPPPEIGVFWNSTKALNQKEVLTETLAVCVENTPIRQPADADSGGGFFLSRVCRR